MQSKYLKDAHGTIIGRLEMLGNGDQRLYSPSGNYLGIYKECVDTTTNGHGNYVGQGNLLMMLL